MTVDEARSRVSELGFKTRMGVLEKESTAQAVGKVFAQDPEEGTVSERKSGKITITIAKAAPIAAKMSNLIGMDESQATQASKSASFTGNLRITKVTTTDPTKPANRIYSQSVAPGAELDKNSSDVSMKIVISPQATVSTSPFPSSSPSKTG